MICIETIGDRIKILIKTFSLTQKEFAENLKITPARINQIITNNDIPSDMLLNLISKSYNINFEWLKKGTGEMLLSSNNTSNITEDIISLINNLDEPSQSIALNILKQLVEFREISIKNDRHN